ncbi:MAG: diguanylate cyclase, partial [Gammaproteobacteria bacterium]|nr:diguanylate cyclase [Gammaproteobacteria bacterium]
ILKVIFFDIAIAMETYNEVQQQSILQQNNRLNELNNIAITVNATLGLNETLTEVMRGAMRLVDAQAAAIVLFDIQKKIFSDTYAEGLSEHFIKNMSFRRGGLADEVFHTQSYCLSNDLSETKYKLSGLTRGEGIQSFICLPLISHKRRLGVFYLYFKSRHNLLEHEYTLLNTLTHIATGAIGNAHMHSRTVTLAMTDELTDLLNRREFTQRLNQELKRSQRNNNPFSIVMVDIDHFKNINDQYGHTSGDIVLQELGQIFLGALRDIDVIARYGGEEFIFLLPDTSEVFAFQVAERIRHLVEKHTFHLPEHLDLNITISLGISCFPETTENQETLIEHADQSLYMAKHGGRNQTASYANMLTREFEINPSKVVDLLNESLDNIPMVITAIYVNAQNRRNHAIFTEQYSHQIADRLGLSDEQKHLLKYAALLHDAGLLFVPENVLLKEQALNEDDWERLKQHPETGAELISQIPALADTADIIRHHHERYDGNGYPDGLVGDNIPLLSRIISIADSYCNLRFGLPTREPMSTIQACEELQKAAGTQFDPTLVEVFLATIHLE